MISPEIGNNSWMITSSDRRVNEKRRRFHGKESSPLEAVRRKRYQLKRKCLLTPELSSYFSFIFFLLSSRFQDYRTDERRDKCSAFKLLARLFNPWPVIVHRVSDEMTADPQLLMSAELLVDCPSLRLCLGKPINPLSTWTRLWSGIDVGSDVSQDFKWFTRV